MAPFLLLPARLAGCLSPLRAWATVAWLLAVYTDSAQVLFCKQAISGLGDLAGRRVRESSAPQADLIEALGGVPVLAPFAELPLLEQAVWADAERETAQGNTCNTGNDACKPGQRGQRVGIPPNAADQTRLRQALAGTVLPRWAQRCGPRCSEAWDSSLVPLLGLPLPPATR